MIRLSICIATLNRAGFIGQTLDSILSQMTNEVELIVVDGASTDGTDLVVNALFAGRPNCHYHRLRKKGGVDQDYCRSVERAAGTFCWLMTDDDLLKPHAVRKVLDCLNDDLDLLLVNSETANRDLTHTLVDQRLQIQVDRVFRPDQQADLLAQTGELMSFIATVVIRRTTWLERDQIPYLGSEFVHVGTIFQSPLQRKTWLIAEPLIRIRYGNAQWADRAFEIWIFKWPRLIWSFPHLPRAAKQQVVPQEAYQNLVALCAMKARGCFGWREYSMTTCLRMGVINRPVAYLLAAFPPILFNALASIVFMYCASLFKWDPLIGEDLRISQFNVWRRWFNKAR